MEIWKDIPGYEGIYQASTHGRIRSNEDKVTYTKHHGIRKWKQRIMKQTTKTDKRKRVILWKDGNSKTHLVHRLIAGTFIPNPERKKFINHKDGDPQNNHISNLEWCTSKENNNHAFDNGLISSTPTILCIEGQKIRFRSMAKASEYLGLTPGAISCARNRGNNKVAGVEFETLPF